MKVEIHLARREEPSVCDKPWHVYTLTIKENSDFPVQENWHFATKVEAEAFVAELKFKNEDAGSN